MREWALATSPYGLGLTAEQSWSRTPREFQALMDVRNEHLKLWAIERVEFRNAHRLFGDTELPWELDDILHSGVRAQRVVEAQAEMIARKVRLTQMNAGLAGITKDSTSEKLPSWAKRQWDPKDYPHLFGGGKN